MLHELSFLPLYLVLLFLEHSPPVAARILLNPSSFPRPSWMSDLHPSLSKVLSAVSDFSLFLFHRLFLQQTSCFPNPVVVSASPWTWSNTLAWQSHLHFSFCTVFHSPRNYTVGLSWHHSKLNSFTFFPNNMKTSDSYTAFVYVPQQYGINVKYLILALF